MINIDIHTYIYSVHDLDHLRVLSKSFELTHPDNNGGVICIVADEIEVSSLPEIQNVRYTKTYPTGRYIFFSVEQFFMNKLYSLVARTKDTCGLLSYYHDGEKNDFRIVNDIEADLPHEFSNVNFTIEPRADRLMYYKILKHMRDVVTLNTRKFKPSDTSQINSIYTLTFPWELYFNVLRQCDGVSDSFKSDVVFNCKRFSHSIWYRYSNILNIGE